MGASISNGSRAATVVSQISSQLAAGCLVISLNSTRLGAAARPERSGSGILSSSPATNRATSRGAVRPAKS
jgi:hypothetical protein